MPEANLIRICYTKIQIKIFILTAINSFTLTTITSKQDMFYIYVFINYVRYGGFDISCAEVLVYILNLLQKVMIIFQFNLISKSVNK
ncbi:hypothetical protein T10_5293 [Trichinella papuae]|uniref:Uncharacterized protein n=1 Tax=Trichinella papuae TaxID=268474 RepID=A0A0V1MHA5_9BILA|nr:hypothetical protein T10_5293 [Trichinella papuae]